ncbi:hypothetical protein BDZ45DRAFT_751921 [Acephala macrosclerotiorum]|nr:hypothetical protein BDZ45DRAFT_751921 [Acephala macrosclerotiorum]
MIRLVIVQLHSQHSICECPQQLSSTKAYSMLPNIAQTSIFNWHAPFKLKMPLPIYIPSNDNNDSAHPSEPSQISNNTTNEISTFTQNIALSTDPIPNGAPPLPPRSILRRSLSNSSNAVANSHSNFSTEIHPALRASEETRTRRPRSRRSVSFEDRVLFHSPESSNPSPTPSPGQNGRSSRHTGTNGSIQQEDRLHASSEEPFPGFHEAFDSIRESQHLYEMAMSEPAPNPFSEEQPGAQERRNNVGEGQRYLSRLQDSLEHALSILRRELENINGGVSDPDQNLDRELSRNTRTSNDDSDSDSGDSPGRDEFRSRFIEIQNGLTTATFLFDRTTDAIMAVPFPGSELSDQERRNHMGELDEADRSLTELQESLARTLRVLRERVESADRIDIESAAIEGGAADASTRELRRGRRSGGPSTLVPDDSASNLSPTPSDTSDTTILPPDRRTQTAVEILAPGPRSPIADQIRQLPGYQGTPEAEADAASLLEDNGDEITRATREGAPSPENLRPQNPTPNRARGDETANLDDRVVRLTRGPPRRDNTGRGSSSVADSETRDVPSYVRGWPGRTLTDEQIEYLERHELERERAVREALASAGERSDAVEDAEQNIGTALDEITDLLDQVPSSNDSNGTNTSPSSTGATAGSVGEASISSTIQAVEGPRPSRQQMMRQMVAEMERYSRQREREFEREHGYCK